MYNEPASFIKYLGKELMGVTFSITQRFQKVLGKDNELIGIQKLLAPGRSLL